MKLLRPVLMFLPAFGPLCAATSLQEEFWNGRDFTGFYTFLERSGKNHDPQQVFRIHDGLIHVSGREYGYLSTEREYENYVFRVEFKWGEVTWPPREKKARD